MWVEMDGDEGGGGGGGGGTGDERKLITWHKPAHPSLTHLSVRSRDGGEGGREGVAVVKEADISCVVVGLMTHKGGPCAWGHTHR